MWDGDALIGGLYGVAVGRMFSAESMFSRRTNASKVALHALAQTLQERGFPLIDAQVPNPHLLRMGAHDMPRTRFLATRCACTRRSGPRFASLPSRRARPRSPSTWGIPICVPSARAAGRRGSSATSCAGAHRSGATYFNQRFRDMIQYNGLVADGAANYYNLAAANSDGVEVTLRVSPVTPLTLAASYTYTKTRVTNAGIDSSATASFVEGQRLLRRPASLASATASYAFRRPETSLHLEVATIGDRDDRDFSDEVTFVPKAVTLPSYTVVALAGELGILRRGASASPEIVLTARVDNLFDRHYQQIFGFASPRRTFLVGARIGIAR